MDPRISYLNIAITVYHDPYKFLFHKKEQYFYTITLYLVHIIQFGGGCRNHISNACLYHTVVWESWGKYG